MLCRIQSFGPSIGPVGHNSQLHVVRSISGITFNRNLMKSLERCPYGQLFDFSPCGICDGEPVLDLDYVEDSAADTDANFVMTGKGGIVEIQGTAEGEPFSDEEFAALTGLAKKGITRLVDLQKMAIG